MPGATRYERVPPELTAPTPAPAAPVPLCLDPYQYPVLCSGQLVIWHLGVLRALEQANADKAAIATLGSDDGR